MASTACPPRLRNDSFDEWNGERGNRRRLACRGQPQGIFAGERGQRVNLLLRIEGIAAVDGYFVLLASDEDARGEMLQREVGLNVVRRILYAVDGHELADVGSLRTHFGAGVVESQVAYHMIQGINLVAHGDEHLRFCLREQFLDSLLPVGVDQYGQTAEEVAVDVFVQFSVSPVADVVEHHLLFS